MAEQVLVAFDGPGSGTGELTWGQLSIWPTMQAERTSTSIGGAFPVPAGMTVSDVADGLSFLMSRFGALRTRIEAGPGGQLQQSQVSSGRVALDIVEAGDADPEEVAWAQYRRYEELARQQRTPAGQRAYKYAYYDPRERDELIGRISAERGEEIDLDCGVNDRRLGGEQQEEGPPPGPGEVRAALAQSRLFWGFRRDQPNGRCFLRIDNVPGTVHYELRADTRYLTPADLETCLRGLERALAEAVLGEAVPDGELAGTGPSEAGPIEAGLDPATAAEAGRG